MDRIKARYPLNEKEKKVIKRYEKKTPGEPAHIDVFKLTYETPFDKLQKVTELLR
ncbi:MAG: hypothetical protein ACE5IH_02980 [Thermodesulfobacteriota bacterium]